MPDYALIIALSAILAAPSIDARFGHGSRHVHHHAINKRAAVSRSQTNAGVRVNVSIGGSSSEDCKYKLVDSWEGRDFFSGWDFFTGSDPTHGQVDFVDQPTAHLEGLAYVDPAGLAVMKVDSVSNLNSGEPRKSVRITTQKAYNGGLFVLDALQFPFGCAVWPAFWMFGPDWPNSGELDIWEGVNQVTANQYTAHTAVGCSIDKNSPPEYRVSPLSSTVGLTDCGPTAYNSGCDFIDTNQHSYGSGLNDAGGAVLAMEWTTDGMKIWMFPRSHVPLDLSIGRPIPLLWSPAYLKAAWASTTCPTSQYFKDMSIVFDMTLCGDWAGNVYGASGCPGSCASQVMTGSNFVDAMWKVKSVKVYQ